jgi:hypothetical protein
LRDRRHRNEDRVPVNVHVPGDEISPLLLGETGGEVDGRQHLAVATADPHAQVGRVEEVEPVAGRRDRQRADPGLLEPVGKARQSELAQKEPVEVELDHCGMSLAAGHDDEPAVRVDRDVLGRRERVAAGHLEQEEALAVEHHDPVEAGVADEHLAGVQVRRHALRVADVVVHNRQHQTPHVDGLLRAAVHAVVPARRVRRGGAPRPAGARPSPARTRLGPPEELGAAVAFVGDEHEPPAAG